MRFRVVVYYIWVSPLILACSLFYTVILMSVIRQLISLEGLYLRAAWVVTYVVICVIGFAYYAPRMRNIWLVGAMEEKYRSTFASWVGVVIGATTFTAIFIPQIEEIKFLNGVPFFLVVSFAFTFFLCVMAFFSFGVWKSRG